MHGFVAARGKTCDNTCLVILWLLKNLDKKVGVTFATVTWEEEVDVSGDREWCESGLGAELISRYIFKEVIYELQFSMERAPDLPIAWLGLQARLFNDALASFFKQIITVTHWLLCPASTLGLCSCSSAYGDSMKRGGWGWEEVLLWVRGIPGFCLR